MESQGNDIALGLAGFNISPSLTQYLGSMLIKDLRGTESTQDACAKMRVRRPWGRGLHLQPVVDDADCGGGSQGFTKPCGGPDYQTDGATVSGELPLPSIVPSTRKVYAGGEWVFSLGK